MTATVQAEPTPLEPGRAYSFHGHRLQLVSLDVTLGRGPFDTGPDCTAKFVHVPPPAPPRRPKIGEVWRHKDGDLYLVGHTGHGAIATSLGGGRNGYPDSPGGFWSCPRPDAGDVFGDSPDAFTFYATSPKAAFDRRVRES